MRAELLHRQRSFLTTASDAAAPVPGCSSTCTVQGCRYTSIRVQNFTAWDLETDYEKTCIDPPDAASLLLADHYIEFCWYVKDKECN